MQKENAKSWENVQTGRIIHFWILFYLNSTTELICVNVSNTAIAGEQALHLEESQARAARQRRREREGRQTPNWVAC